MVKVTDVTGIGPVTAKALSEHKIKTVEALAAISLAELQKVPGFSDLRAKAVKKAAANCLLKAAKQPATPAKSAKAPVNKAPVKKTSVKKPVKTAPVAKQVSIPVAASKVESKKKEKEKEKVKDQDKKKDKPKDKKKTDKKKGKSKK